MKKILLLFVSCLAFNSNVMASYVVQSWSKSAQQYYLHGYQETDNSEHTAFINGYATHSAYTPFHVAAGIESDCPYSSRRYAQDQATTASTYTTIEVDLDELWNQTGWYAQPWPWGSTQPCDFKYKFAVVFSTAWTLDGTGINWAIGTPGYQVANSSETFYMIKPECEENCDSPIVIDIEGNGFEFTSLEDGVLFDIDADGVLERTAWIAKESDDAFLYFDYDKNDNVDFSELFGNHASLLSGKIMAHGYEELAELDAVEYFGNNDGFIDDEDYYFKYLGLWKDINHNGESELDEVYNLRDLGVEVLSLELILIDWIDTHGNWIEYASWSYGKSKGKKKTPFEFYTADVWFVTEEID